MICRLLGLPFSLVSISMYLLPSLRTSQHNNRLSSCSLLVMQMQQLLPFARRGVASALIFAIESYAREKGRAQL